jgi:hypothetical protein
LRVRKLTLDIDLRAFAQVFPGYLSQLSEQNDAVPFRLLFLLASGFISP